MYSVEVLSDNVGPLLPPTMGRSVPAHTCRRTQDGWLFIANDADEFRSLIRTIKAYRLSFRIIDGPSE